MFAAKRVFPRTPSPPRREKVGQSQSCSAPLLLRPLRCESTGRCGFTPRLQRNAALADGANLVRRRGVLVVRFNRIVLVVRFTHRTRLHDVGSSSELVGEIRPAWRSRLLGTWLAAVLWQSEKRPQEFVSRFFGPQRARKPRDSSGFRGVYAQDLPRNFDEHPFISISSWPRGNQAVRPE